MKLRAFRVAAAMLCVFGAMTVAGCGKARTENEKVVDTVLTTLNTHDPVQIHDTLGYSHIKTETERYAAMTDLDWDWVTFQVFKIDFCEECHTVGEINENEYGTLEGGCKCGKVKPNRISTFFENNIEVCLDTYLELRVPANATLKIDGRDIPVAYAGGSDEYTITSYTGYFPKDTKTRQYEVTLENGEKRTGTFTYADKVLEEGYANAYIIKLGFDA